MTHGDGRRTDGERETFARFSPLHPNTEEAPGDGGNRRHTLTCKPICWRLRESYMIGGIIVHIRGGGNKKRGRLAQRRMTTLNSAEANVPWRKGGREEATCERGENASFGGRGPNEKRLAWWLVFCLSSLNHADRSRAGPGH